MEDNVARITPYSITYHYTDADDKKTCYIRYFDSASAMCYWAARLYAFSDFDDTIKIDAIKSHGREIVYAGWQPGMLIEFIDKQTRESVWADEFPVWDH